MNGASVAAESDPRKLRVRRALIATTNPGKIREFAEMLCDDETRWLDLSAFAAVADVEETGLTFRANACLKAAAYARQFGILTVADDSGLVVDAIDGGPGVYSARWAARHEAGSGDEANNLLLLRQMASVPPERRSARFVCALALASAAGEVIYTAEDSVEGRLLDEPRGSNGFGYDPLFLIEELGKTTAELSAMEKHAISHRGRALRRLKALIEQFGLPPDLPKSDDGRAGSERAVKIAGGPGADVKGRG